MAKQPTLAKAKKKKEEELTFKWGNFSIILGNPCPTAPICSIQ